MIREFISPMLCETSKPFDSQEFIFEPKLDGERALFIIDKAKENWFYFRIQNRRVFDITQNFPEFSNFDYLKENVGSIILDGELVLNNGKSKDYHDIKFKKRTHIKSSIKSKFLSNITPLTYYVFDVLFLNGKDLRELPLHERKMILFNSIKPTERVKLIEQGAEGLFYYQICLNEGFEGMIAKKFDSKYENKRSNSWLKIKPILTKEVEVLDYKETSGWGSHGGLITEFGDVAMEREEIRQEYLKLREGGRVMIEVRYQEMTPNNRFRFPKFNKFIGG